MNIAVAPKERGTLQGLRGYYAEVGGRRFFVVDSTRVRGLQPHEGSLVPTPQWGGGFLAGTAKVACGCGESEPCEVEVEVKTFPEGWGLFDRLFRQRGSDGPASDGGRDGRP